jgi:hypothetical protein
VTETPSRQTTRRRFLSALAGTGLLATSGCLDASAADSETSPESKGADPTTDDQSVTTDPDYRRGDVDR